MKRYLIVIGCLLLIAAGFFGTAYYKRSARGTVETVSTRNNAGLIVTDNRVFDQADLLSDAEEQSLERDIKQVRQEKKTDIVMVTTNDAEGKNSEAYADDFYDTHDFGYEDSHGTGILFLIDMDNRNIWISTSGACMKYYTSSRIDDAIDTIYDELKSGQYALVFSGLLSSVSEYMYDDTGFDMGYLGYAAIIGGILAGLVLLCLVVNRGGSVTVSSGNYLVGSSKDVYRRSDVHYDTVVHKRKIESNSSGGGGGSHHSSGGFSHGGGGRSF